MGERKRHHVQRKTVYCDLVTLLVQNLCEYIFVDLGHNKHVFGQISQYFMPLMPLLCVDQCAKAHFQCRQVV